MRIFLFLIFILIRNNESANILMLSGIPSPSHFIFNKALVYGLAAQGHNLTFLSPDIEKKVPKNVHFIHLEEVYSHYYNGSDHIDLLEMSKESKFKSVISFYDFGAFMCEGIQKSAVGLNLIRNYPKDFKFDLVLHDYTVGSCLLGLLPKFGYPPLIGLSAFSNPPYTVDITGGDKLGLTTKPFYLLSYDIDMNIFQRLENGVMSFLDSFYRKYFSLPAIDVKMREMFGSDLPPSGELEKKAVLTLVNSNPVIDFPDSLPPNTIEVGGMQISEPKPLPEKFEKFLMKGVKGSVLMSLGTNIRSDSLGADNIKTIVEVFRQIPDYNFVWKFETSEMLSELPSNVMISDWLPQNDILAHSKLKLFITHGGMLSTHEATWRGIPMVGIPFLADQYRNLHKSVKAGVAVKIDFDKLSHKTFKNAILEVLNNQQKYHKNMERRSKLFRDQPEKPLDRALWWMKAWIVISLLYIFIPFAKANVEEDTRLDVLGLLRKYGYAAENHRVTTSDGYILNMHRCPGGPVSPPRFGKQVVFLMHGMLSSSADYVLMGPQTSLVYMLSDLGYDVWMGNSRGNRYSNTHSTLNNETEAYWDFSWHEIGSIDLPAMIDYALVHTNRAKLHYVGHSMGTTAYLVMISERPTYGNKIISSQLLAPAAYMHNVKSPYVIWLATYLYSMQLALNMMGTYYFAPTSEMDKEAAYDDCRDGAPYQGLNLKDLMSKRNNLLCVYTYLEMCSITTFLIAGFNSQEVNSTMLPVIHAHSPAGASTKNMIHYAQIVRSRTFRQFDYDGLNFYRYGQLYPPNYRFTGHIAPISFYHSTNDWMATPNDVNTLYSRLTANQVQLKYLVPQTAFNHMDFVWAINVRSLVYNRMVEDIKKWDATYT
ncbi:CLUMA_CG012143, isoform A [Clunio marinus]|uniref:CLUMA_CG012143, isoform A n=1 Tax=Clunio marinus TaxID=568069 RepID=A0A1J1IF58_9DIPT|nr:CLUMA_CG012143, isoform A [Clunio marinus]